MKDNNFNFNQVFLNTLDSKTLEQLLSFSHLENVSAYISGKSLSILLAKASFGFLLISMLSYWFQLSFKSEMLMKSTNAQLLLTSEAEVPTEGVKESKPLTSEALLAQREPLVRGLLYKSNPYPVRATICNSWSGVSSFVKAITSHLLSDLKKVPLVTMWFANITLAILLSIRWIESGHFPLSNLYESLIFLSWSLTVIHLFLENLFYKKEQILDNTKTLTPLSAITLPRKGLVQQALPGPASFSSETLIPLRGMGLAKQIEDKKAQGVAKQEEVAKLDPKGVRSRGLLVMKQKITSNEASVPTLTLGAITSPVALFTNAFATFSLPQEMQKVTVLVPALKSNWLIMHVSVMIISYAALLSGSLLAMAFLVVKFLNDNKTPSIVYTSINGIGYAKERFKSLLLFPSQALRGKKLAKLNFLHSFRPSLYPSAITLPSVASEGSGLLLAKRGGACKAEKQRNSACTDADVSLLVSAKQLLTPYPEGSATSEGYGSKNEIDSKLITPNLLTPSINPLSFHKEMLSSNALPHRGIASLPSDATLGKLVNTASSFTPYPEGVKGYGAFTPAGSEAGKGEEKKITKNFQFLDLPHILDNLSYRSIGLGFALLTIGILSGAVWANEAWGSYWSWDPKETWAFITWLVFALYLHTRLSKGWVGKESAFVASFGFVVIWFCYLGVNLFGKGLHSYGWFQP